MDAILTAPHSDLVAEANHRVANSLTLLSGLVRMQAKAAGQTAKSFSNAEVRMMFDGVAARIATVGQLHRMLAYLPADGTVDFGMHLRDLSNTLIAAFSSEHQSIQIEHHGMECHVLNQNVRPLTLILCELLTNAMKYAHPSGIPVRIEVRCEALGGGDLMVSVSDDGVGLPEGFDTGKDSGIGFQIIRAMTAEMGAQSGDFVRYPWSHLPTQSSAGSGRQRADGLILATFPGQELARPGNAERAIGEVSSNPVAMAVLARRGADRVGRIDTPAAASGRRPRLGQGRSFHCLFRPCQHGGHDPGIASQDWLRPSRA